jgi:hypothetical protein
MSGACRAHKGDYKWKYRVLGGTPRGERPLGRPCCGWENNLGTESDRVNWIRMAQTTGQWRLVSVRQSTAN